MWFIFIWCKEIYKNNFLINSVFSGTKRSLHLVCFNCLKSILHLSSDEGVSDNSSASSYESIEGKKRTFPNGRYLWSILILVGSFASIWGSISIRNYGGKKHNYEINNPFFTGLRLLSWNFFIQEWRQPILNDLI